MKFIFYSDTHFHDYQEFYRMTEKGYSNRMDLMLKSLRFVFNYAIENNIVNCIHGGDMYEVPRSINTVISSLVSSVYHDNKYDRLKHYYITGNHDVVDKNQHYSSMASMNKTFKRVFDKNNFGLEYLFQKDDKCNCFFLPYNDKLNDKVLRLLMDVKNKKDIVLIGHLEIEGVKYDKGFISKGEINKSIFREFKKVIMGHIHLRQEIGNNVVYPGSLMEHSFKDNTGLKGFMVYDSETNKCEFIENPYSPKLKEIIVNKVEDVSSLKNEDSNFYRFHIEMDNLEEYEEALSKLNNKNIVPVIKKQNENIRIDVNNKVTPEYIINQYVEFQRVFERETSLKRYGKVLFNKGMG